MKNQSLFEIPRLIALIAVMAVLALHGHAQLLHTSYFMEGTQYRLSLNPALAPTRGFVHVPAAGAMGASLYSDGIALNDMIDIVKNSDHADYFADDRFMGRLKDTNHAAATAGTDILAAGWWHGNSFMSINLSFRVNADLRAPKALFSFMRDMHGMNTIDYSDFTRSIGGEKLELTAYTEIGFGYMRPLSANLDAGFKVKGLLGHGNMRLTVHDAVVTTRLHGLSPDYDWTYGDPTEVLVADGTASIDVQADWVSSFEGLELQSNGKDYIDEIKFKAANMGVAGYGAAVDLGFSWRPTRRLTVSASLVDLGLIRWTKGCTRVAHANTADLHFDSNSSNNLAGFSDIIATTTPINTDILRLTLDDNAAKARTTHLASTVTCGVDYALQDGKVNVGALYTHHHSAVRAQDEVTLSLGYRPHRHVELAVSCSPLMCGGKAAGVAVKAGPVFLGTDYIYMGRGTKTCNAMAGISIPLGSKP